MKRIEKIIEKKYFESLKGKKKRVSLNLREYTINVVNKLSNALNLPKNVIVDAALLLGFKRYIEILQKGIKEILKKEKDRQKLQKFMKIDKNLEKIKKSLAV